MTTTATCTLELPLVDFRRAIAAVRPHAERAKSGDDVNAFGRVRLTAAADELWVSATNGTTAALAAVRILEDSRAERFADDDGVFSVDLSPILAGDLRDGLRLVRGDIDEDQQVCELTLTDSIVAIRDISGLWPDSTTTRPLLPYDSEFPDLLDVLSRQMSTAMTEVKPLTVPAGAVGLFTAASRQYGRPLVFEPTGPKASRGFLCWCGPRFVGSISSGHDDGDSLARRESERRAHLERLGLTPALAAL